MKFIKHTFSKILVIFLISRFVVFIGEVVGFIYLPFKHSFPYIADLLVLPGLPQVLWQWGNFDGVHYLSLATRSYNGFGVQAFFPGYPIGIKMLSLLIPNLLLSGFIISNVCFLFGLYYFHNLVKKTTDENTAWWSVLFLAFFPTSFFFSAVYSESLFLFLIILAFSCQGLFSGFFSLFAGLTRLSGLFLVPSFLLVKPRNWWGMLSVLGLGSFMIYLFLKFNNALFFLTSQSAFQNGRSSTLLSLVNPFQVIFRYLKIFHTTVPSNYDFWVATLEFAAFTFGTLVLGYLTYRRKLPKGFLILGWLSLILPSFSGTFSSMPRYLLTIFPIFIGLGLIPNIKIRLGILVGFVLLLVLLSALFTRGYWVA